MQRLILKERAKNTIKGRVFFSFLVLLVLSLIVGAAESITLRTGPYISLLLSIAIFIAAIPLQNGAYIYFYNIAIGKKEDFGDLFAAYKNDAFKELVKAKLLVTLYVLLGVICFIIPGIYFAIKYAMVDYAFAENPKITYREAMDESAKIMKGKIWDYFVLMLSFILWYFLIIISFGIAAIYVMPYVHATTAHFYLDAKGMITVMDDSFAYNSNDKYTYNRGDTFTGSDPFQNNRPNGGNYPTPTSDPQKDDSDLDIPTSGDDNQ